MPLESCMILLDNSEYMRNGDYVPTRLEAQHDAANMLVGQKTQSNPESTVGVIAMCGGSMGFTGGGSAGAELLVSPTDDMGKILSALHGVPVRGSSTAGYGGDKSPSVDIPASVQVASLALKHRRNKNGAQRVVMFVGSPLEGVTARELVRAGRQLKKNNVYIDVVCMGELEGNEDKLKGMVDAANGSSSGDEERMCHLVTIPPGVLPSDVLVTSPIVHGGAGGGAAAGAAAGSPGGAGAAAGGGGGGDAFAEFGGVDPNMDPELAMALRVSMEEERARQERAAREQAESSGAEETKEGEEGKEEGKEEEEAKEGEGMEVDAAAEEGSAPAAAPPAPTAAAAGGFDMGMGDEEDALLQQALAMSMQEHAATQETEGSDEKEEEKPSAAAAKKEEGVEVPMETDEAAAAAGGAEGEEDEDAAMQMALAMSMQEDAAEAEPKKEAAKKEDDAAEAKPQQFQDPQFVNQLLGSLPGVDPNDPAIQSALKEMNKKGGDDKKEGDKKGEDK